MGSVSAAITINSDIPRFRVFVAKSASAHETNSEEVKRRTFVSSFTDLFVVTCLLYEFQDLCRKGLIGEWKRFGIRS